MSLLPAVRAAAAACHPLPHGGPIVWFQVRSAFNPWGLGPWSRGPLAIHRCDGGVPGDRRSALATASAAGFTLGFLKFSLLSFFVVVISAFAR